MINKKISVAIDCDDVLFSCIPYAIDRVNKRFNKNITIDQITGWGSAIGDANLIFNEWETADFFENQPTIKGSHEFIRELSKFCDIYIATAIDYRFMSIRMKRIMEEFPEINPSNILMGTSKNKIKTDFLLDDGFHNIRSSIAEYPVLLRKPWSRNATGVLSVNKYEEFLTLIDEIQNSRMYKRKKIEEPTVIALIGPSGSRKNEIIEEVIKENNKIKRIKTYTTNPNDKLKEHITKEEFKKMRDTNVFCEYTIYAGYEYGSTIEDIEEELKKGNNVILPMDIGGIIALKTNFNNVISVYINRYREDIILDIIERNIDNKEKVQRIISLDMERKNKKICDYVIDGNKGIEEIGKDVRKIVD